jgi:hypothetical protein
MLFVVTFVFSVLAQAQVLPDVQRVALNQFFDAIGCFDPSFCPRHRRRIKGAPLQSAIWTLFIATVSAASRSVVSGQLPAAKLFAHEHDQLGDWPIDEPETAFARKRHNRTRTTPIIRKRSNHRYSANTADAVHSVGTARPRQQPDQRHAQLSDGAAPTDGFLRGRKQLHWCRPRPHGLNLSANVLRPEKSADRHAAEPSFVSLWQHVQLARRNL